MKQPRTIKIIRLISGVVRSTLKGDRLVLDQSSAQLEQLGGIYIKFLQIVVLNLDPYSQSGYQKLLSVYESSQPDAINIRDYLAHELSPQAMAQIQTVDDLPFATGSFGQVYRAKLIDGQTVIIKVLRPSVRRYLNYDLRLLGFLCWAYAVIDRQKMLNYKEMFADFKRTCLEETNYLREAALATQYYEDYQNHPHLVIPRTYKELTTTNVIVQQCIEGISVTNLLALQTTGTDAQEYCQYYLHTDLFLQLKVIGSELLNKVLMGDIAQADPHPGNIIILPNNRVALIDFGMSTQLRENRQYFYELVLQYRQFYRNQLSIEDFTLAALKFLAPELYGAIKQADTLFNTDGTMGSTITNKFREAVQQTITQTDNKLFIDQLLSRRAIMKVLFFAINRDNRFGFSFDLSSTALLKAVQAYFVMMGRFDPTARVVREMFEEVIGDGQRHLDAIMSSPATTLTPSEALETLSCWFDKMARNDPWLMSRVVGSYLE